MLYFLRVFYLAIQYMVKGAWREWKDCAIFYVSYRMYEDANKDLYDDRHRLNIRKIFNGTPSCSG
jgi:hypothetical protein